MRLLFVCTGNTCRSPLAEAAWRAFGAPVLLKKEIKSEASSAGLAAVPGISAAKSSVVVAKSWGQDLSGHTSRHAAADLVRAADYVLTMTGSHAQALRKQFPGSKVIELGKFCGSDTEPDELNQLLGIAPGDILDPVGGSREAYEECGAHIKDAVLGLAVALRDGTL